MFICDISILNKYAKEKIYDMLIKYNIDWRIMVVLLVAEQIPGVSQVRLYQKIQWVNGGKYEFISNQS